MSVYCVPTDPSKGSAEKMFVKVHYLKEYVCGGVCVCVELLLLSGSTREYFGTMQFCSCEWIRDCSYHRQHQKADNGAGNQIWHRLVW